MQTMRGRIVSIAISLLSLSAVHAMAVTSHDIAVVGCGVLGTSLCEQLLSDSEFRSTSGKIILTFWTYVAFAF